MALDLKLIMIWKQKWNDGSENQPLISVRRGIEN
jgi:hypothetical protein